MNYLIGIDAGTSGLRTVLYDEAGNVIAQASKSYAMQQPHNGWAEQDPRVWKEAMFETIKEVVTQSKVPSESIQGLGLAGQMHGLVMLDENGDVIRPAILWCDQRTQEEVEDMLALCCKERWMQLCANPPMTGWTAAKILWVRKHEPEQYQACRSILLPKDYLRYCLTGIYASDVSDASGTQVFDVAHRCWSKEVMEVLDLDPSMFAKVYESCEVVGTLLPTIADALGLSATLRIVAGASDNAAAAIATGVVRASQAFTTIGTSGVVYAHSDHMICDPQGRIHTCCCAVPNAWHVMGVTQAAGLSLKWFKEQCCFEEEQLAKQTQQSVYDLMNEQIEQIPIGSQQLLYLPYLMGERTPHMDPTCRGVFFGLSPIHTKAHMERAIMEGVAFSLKDCYSIFSELQLVADQMLVCGGGAKSTNWRTILTNVLGCQSVTIDKEEGPAFGAMILAGVGCGIYESVEAACDKLIHTSKEIDVTKQDHQQYTAYYELYQSLYPALQKSFQQLSKL